MKDRQKKQEKVLILHNIRSNHNVGSLFRTADCVGIHKIYLTGYTPTPIDRFGREVTEIKKTALGAEKNIPYEKNKNISSVINKLKEEGFQMVAIEQAKSSVDYKSVKVKNKTAFILGNEVKGISPAILQRVDLVCEIPLKGKKESLNVSVAGAVALFRLLGV